MLRALARGAAIACLAVALLALGAHTAAGADLKKYERAAPAAPVGLVAASDEPDWLVATNPGRQPIAVATRHRATALLGLGGVFRVPASRAAAFARALRARGQLRYAEPDVRFRQGAKARASRFPLDPLSGGQWWISQVIAPDVTPPSVAGVPPVGVVDSRIDVAHPDVIAGNVSQDTFQPFTDEHGTAVATIIGASPNGAGIVGLWPGAPVRVFASQLRCSDLAAAVDRAVIEGVRVVNLSFGATAQCYTLYESVQQAYGRNVLVVAAGGNDFEVGNRPVYPASWPHVLTVAATAPDRSSAFFSNENEGIDLAAPGVGIPAGVPAAFDNDGVRDGYTPLSGTSFSAPLVSAAAGWLRAVRPELSPGQSAQLLNATARDLGPAGWDQRFGWGLLQVGSDFSRLTPRHDPYEPNDDLAFIDGRAFGKRDRVALDLRGQRVPSVTASLDDWEDADDCYWLTVPARSRVSIRLDVRRGDVDLFAYRSGTPTILGPRGRPRRKGLISASIRLGSQDEQIVVRNSGARGQVAIAARIYVPGRGLDAGYRLTARRLRYP